MKEQNDNKNVYKNFVFIKRANDDVLKVLLPNAEIDQDTTKGSDSIENNIFNYYVYDGGKSDRLKEAPPIITQEKLVNHSPNEQFVSSMF